MLREGACLMVHSHIFLSSNILREFAMLAVDLLEVCYKTDDDITQQLLTYKLQNWSDQTCLSLAVSACHRDFLAHTSCQILLTDMWMGGLRMRRYTSLKVVDNKLWPPLCVCVCVGVV